MPEREGGFYVTIRDVYDRVGEVEQAFGEKLEALERRQNERADAHAKHDDERFAGLNLKFYAVLSGAVAGSITAVLLVVKGLA